jgi:large subunit ribosomal protein L22
MATVETSEIKFRAEARYVRTAPRKAQLVATEIRNLRASEARTALRFMTQAAARDVAGVLDSAIANAESHATHSYDSEDLYVAHAVVGTGPTLKRWRARARGRVGRIRRRTCHITIHLAPIPGAVAAPRPSPEPARRARRPRAEAATAAPPEAAAAEAQAEELVAEEEAAEAGAPAEAEEAQDEGAEVEEGVEEEAPAEPEPTPEPAAEQPEAAAEQPEAVAEQPEAAAEVPEAAAEVPEGVAEEPEATAEAEPKPRAARRRNKAETASEGEDAEGDEG